MSSSFKKEPKGEETPASDRSVLGIPSLSERIMRWEAPASPDKVLNFCDRLCRTYLEADADLRSQLRKAVAANQAVRDSLLGPYLAEIAKHAKSTGDHTRYLRSALLAISLTDGCGDSRDTLMWLAELWREAEEKGVDPEPHYREIGGISSPEAIRVTGGSTAAMILQMLDEGRRKQFLPPPLCGGYLRDREASPGDADRSNNCDNDSRLGTKPGIRRTSTILLVAGVCLTFVGGWFIRKALRARPNDSLTLRSYEDAVVFLVVVSVLIGMGALVSWMAVRADRLTIARRKGRTLKYKTYDEVPWYRREPSGLVFLAALIFAPVSFALCVVCLTGDVYRESYDEEGNLQVWGVGNKIAAVLIPIVQIGFTVLFYLSIAAHRWN